MKKFIAVLLIMVVFASMLSVAAFAATSVDSPENNDPAPVVGPTAPQTGVSVNLGLVIAIAVVSMGTAVVVIKKAVA